jgi:hypothetical protein
MKLTQRRHYLHVLQDVAAQRDGECVVGEGQPFVPERRHDIHRRQRGDVEIHVPVPPIPPAPHVQEPGTTVVRSGGSEDMAQPLLQVDRHCDPFRPVEQARGLERTGVGSITVVE